MSNNLFSFAQVLPLCDLNCQRLLMYLSICLKILHVSQIFSKQGGEYGQNSLYFLAFLPCSSHFLFFLLRCALSVVRGEYATRGNRCSVSLRRQSDFHGRLSRRQNSDSTNKTALHASFQSSSATLVIFLCYLVQMVHRPGIPGNSCVFNYKT